MRASFLTPLDDVIPEQHPANDKIWGIFEWPEILSIGIGLFIILGNNNSEISQLIAIAFTVCDPVIVFWVVCCYCLSKKKKKKQKKEQSPRQELNAANGLRRNPSHRAGDWPDWDPVRQQVDDEWIPIQPGGQRSPQRQLSLYVEENVSLQGQMRSFKPAEPAEQNPPNRKSQKMSHDNRDPQNNLYAKPQKGSPRNSLEQQWPRKPIGGLATRNQLSDSSLSSTAEQLRKPSRGLATKNKLSDSSLASTVGATDPQDMMKLWQEEGWYQLGNLHT